MRLAPIALGAFLIAALSALPVLPVAAQDDHDDGMPLTIETAPVRQDIALQCRFTTECYEIEACQDADYAFELTGLAGGMDEVTLLVDAMISGQAGDVAMVGAKDSGALSLSGGGFDARHLLTVAPGGAARYSLHYSDGPMMISYSGSCQ